MRVFNRHVLAKNATTAEFIATTANQLTNATTTFASLGFIENTPPHHKNTEIIAVKNAIRKWVLDFQFNIPSPCIGRRNELLFKYHIARKFANQSEKC